MLKLARPHDAKKRARPLVTLIDRVGRHQMARRARRGGKLTAALGLSAMFGLLIARGARTESRALPMPRATSWRKAVEVKFGSNAGAVIYAEMLARYRMLMDRKPSFGHPALRWHFENGIAPGLALYETLKSRRSGADLALADAREVIAAFAQLSPRRSALALLRYVPMRFEVFRHLTTFFMRQSYPPKGWDIVWRRNDGEALSFDIRRCFYQDVLAAYGAPELTAAFCAGDDVLFGALPPGITWERAGTLATGHAVCDFCWRNHAISPDNKRAALAEGG